MKGAFLCLAVLAAWGGGAADRCAFDFKTASKAIFEGGDAAKNFVTNPNFREVENPSKATSWRRRSTATGRFAGLTRSWVKPDERLESGAFGISRKETSNEEK